MTENSYDVIIVGSGPAGVSAAFPLLDAGLRVLLLDGGREPRLLPPAGPLLEWRAGDAQQWRTMVGSSYYALRKLDAVSPKLRSPTHEYVFVDFESENRVRGEEFVAVGSLARGGLSNAWGGGVACLSELELARLPFSAEEIMPSYAAVARRIGISGAQDDDLSDYFGLDAWAGQPPAMGAVQSRLLYNYAARRNAMTSAGFRIGRSRAAVLTARHDEREACDSTGNCLWGCRRRALYSAVEDLAVLRRHPGFSYRPGFVVREIGGDHLCRTVAGDSAGGLFRFQASRILLAAGTLASTRLALRALGGPREAPLQSCPTAVCVLWAPRFLGRQHENEFGFGQLSFTLALSGGTTGYGSLFCTTGIPVSEFVRHVPMRSRYGIDVLKALLSSCVIGNLFLPGNFTRATVRLDADGTLEVRGDYATELPALMSEARAALRRNFRRLGAVMLPGSFTIGHPGSDIHYTGSLPMRYAPKPGETTPEGELRDVEGVHVVDGAVLDVLTEKPHTMTIMANADRIARKVAQKFRGVSAE